MRTIIAMCTMVVSLSLAGLAASTSWLQRSQGARTLGAGGCREWQSSMPHRLRYALQRSQIIDHQTIGSAVISPRATSLLAAGISKPMPQWVLISMPWGLSF